MSAPLEPFAAELFEQARADYLRVGKPVPPETMLYIVSLSQAASLKRIADVLDGTALGICVTETIFNRSAL